MRNEYVVAEIEVINFTTADIVTASGLQQSGSGETDTPWPF